MNKNIILSGILGLFGLGVLANALFLSPDQVNYRIFGMSMSKMVYVGIWSLFTLYEFAKVFRYMKNKNARQ